jgi:hypothetical protein
MPQHCGETSTKRRATSPVCNAATWVERCRHLNPFAEPAEHYLGHALSSRATHSPRGGLNLQPQSGAGSVSRTETTRLEEKSSRVVFFNCGCAVDNAERASSHSTTWLTVANATPAPRCVRWRAQGPRCLDAPRQMSGFGILTGLIGGSGMPAVSAVDGDRAGQVNRITKSP